MNVYIDESGDLGWKFDKPYQMGGSSRYLTIATLIVPKSLSHLPKRIVRRTYKTRKQSRHIELKGKDLSKEEGVTFAQGAVKLFRRQHQIKAAAITVRKENVQQHIRSDPNKLYNYMVNIVLLDKIKKCSVIDFIPDPRTIKVKSGNSLIDYLQIKLWFEHNSATVIRHQPVESHQSYNLQFVDFLAHLVWVRYEYNESSAFNVLKPYVKMQGLFF